MTFTQQRCTSCGVPWEGIFGPCNICQMKEAEEKRARERRAREDQEEERAKDRAAQAYWDRQPDVLVKEYEYSIPQFYTYMWNNNLNAPTPMSLLEFNAWWDNFEPTMWRDRNLTYPGRSRSWQTTPVANTSAPTSTPYANSPDLYFWFFMGRLFRYSVIIALCYAGWYFFIR